MSQVGGNNMFKMLWDTNFTYDSSMPIYENRPPSWPYTLDYKLFHDCMIPPCPTRSYPGLWEVPMVMWQDLNGGRCSMGDACSNPPTPDGVYKMLIKNFERHYTTNRLVKCFAPANTIVKINNRKIMWLISLADINVLNISLLNFL